MNESKVVWMALAGGAAALGGRAVKAGLDQAWRLALDDDPPDDPTSPDVPWREAILWTVATGVVIGLSQLLIRRGMAAGWERLSGDLPPS